jgi:deoxyribodipyrimidine photo-lyase
MRSIIWFRRDLRLTDNRALHQAARESDQLLAVYFLTPEQWRQHDDAPGKIAFWLENLKCLHQDLKKHNIELLALRCKNFQDIPEILAQLAAGNHCGKVYCNAEYEVNECRRDEQVAKTLRAINVDFVRCHDRLLIEPNRVLTGQGKPYTVYTPFRNNWAQQIFKQPIEVLPAPDPLTPFTPTIAKEISNKFLFDLPQHQHTHPFCQSLWPVGETAAQERLSQFVNASLQSYDKNRDIPAIDGTSRLSPWLAAGIISPRQCLHSVLQAGNHPDKLPDFASAAGAWLNELIWRDFYAHVLVAFPRVGKNLPFQLNTEKIKWRSDDDQLKAWQNGLTGYPIVDAAMRQLKQTGWMHNRLRMIAAMFLSKHLLINWREGERWFMQHLLDGDLAANNGGWQWSASTGTDAAPYFRVFNPFSQSKKFDPQGTFIRQICPELEPVSAKAHHDPKLQTAEITFLKIDYPKPIVEHQSARARAIAAFK